MKKQLFIIGILITNTISAQFYSPNGAPSTLNPSNMNVGIGTNNPQFKLEVAGNASFSDLISSGVNSWIFHTPDDSRTSLFIAPKIGANFDWTKQTEFVNNGNVNFNHNIYVGKNIGVGTLTPQSRLTVSHNGVAGSSQLDLITQHLKNSGRYFMKNIVQGTGADEVTFSLRHDGQMYVDGNVGIGIKEPRSKLTVYENGSEGSSQLQLRTGHNRNGARYFMKNTILGQGTEDVTFSLRHDGQMYVGGKVGIGTSNPDAELSVNGNIHAKEVKVDLNIPADYVFERYYTGKSDLNPEYRMPTLEEIETFTKEQNHLPNLPSAKQIKENGVNIGEITNLLLQKIEELTLYSIEQNKQLKKQAEEIEKLKKRN